MADLASLLPEEQRGAFQDPSIRPSPSEIVKKAEEAVRSNRNVLIYLPEGAFGLELSQVLIGASLQVEGKPLRTLEVLPSETTVDNFLRRSGWLAERLRIERVDRASAKSAHEMKRLLASADLIVMTAAQLAETLSGAVLRFSQLDEFDLFILEEDEENNQPVHFGDDLTTTIRALSEHKARILAIVFGDKKQVVNFAAWGTIVNPLEINVKGGHKKREVRSKANRPAADWRFRRAEPAPRPGSRPFLSILERIFWIGLVLSLLVLDIRLFPVEVILERAWVIILKVVPVLIGLLVFVFLIKLVFNLITWDMMLRDRLFLFLDNQVIPFLWDWNTTIGDRKKEVNGMYFPGRLAAILSGQVDQENEDGYAHADEDDALHSRYLDEDAADDETEDEDAEESQDAPEPLDWPSTAAYAGEAQEKARSLENGAEDLLDGNDFNQDKMGQSQEPGIFGKVGAVIGQQVRYGFKDPGAIGKVSWKASYAAPASIFDESYSIDTLGGEFMGECGVGISESDPRSDDSHVTAFEVWLFDKNDIQTNTQVVVTPRIFQDITARKRLGQKGKLNAAKTGLEIELVTSTLKVKFRLEEVEFDSSGRIFKRARFSIEPGVTKGLVGNSDLPADAIPNPPPDEPGAGDVQSEQSFQPSPGAGQMLVPFPAELIQPAGDPPVPRDALYEEALNLAHPNETISISLLQRRLRIGYPRASRLLAELEQAEEVYQEENGRYRWAGNDAEEGYPSDQTS